MVTKEDCRRATYALFQARDILKGSPCCGDCTRCNLNIKVWGPNRACIANVIDFAADDLLEKAQEGEDIPPSAIPEQKTGQEIMDLDANPNRKVLKIILAKKLNYVGIKKGNEVFYRVVSL